jgi:hypothetical protein
MVNFYFRWYAFANSRGTRTDEILGIFMAERTHQGVEVQGIAKRRHDDLSARRAGLAVIAVELQPVRQIGDRVKSRERRLGMWLQVRSWWRRGRLWCRKHQKINID